MDITGDQGVVKRDKRWRWSVDEKRMICAQTQVPGVSVSQIARRYDVNANQIFNCLKDPRFAVSSEVFPKFQPIIRRALGSFVARFGRVMQSDKGLTLYPAPHWAHRRTQLRDTPLEAGACA